MKEKAAKVDALLKERRELQEAREAMLADTNYQTSTEEYKAQFHDYWDRFTELTDQVWKLTGQRLTLELAEHLEESSMAHVLTRAKVHLQARVHRFNQAGKRARVEFGPYSCRQGWIRAVVVVDGRRYGWYSYGGEYWTTGDDLDKQAKAAYIRRRWYKSPTVELERRHGLATYGEIPSDFRYVTGRLIEGRLYVTPYTSVAWDEVKDGAEFGAGIYKARLCIH
jgi:hypothetical protein